MSKPSAPAARGPKPEASAPRLTRLTDEYLALAAKLRAGGGAERAAKMRAKGQLTPRERVAGLLDADAPWFEIGLLVAHDRYEGQAPAAGVITGIGRVDGREVVVVANDATVKAGSWWPETITKILRAQEVAMRERIPIIYLVDSAGVNLPYQGGVFPGQYGAARIFYYNSLMRRYLHVPQISAVMGSCVAGGAYLPALSDVIYMVEGTSFMGLGGPNLVKGATGRTVDGETLGGAATHTGISAVAHYSAKDDPTCLRMIREYLSRLPKPVERRALLAEVGPARPAKDLAELLPQDHRMSYDARQILACLLDGGAFDEFQPKVAGEMLCGHGRIAGRPVAILANQRGVIKGREGTAPRFGGILYTESAEKSAYFIETAAREGLPILFVQDVSGFMVGTEAEHSGIIRAGARFVEAMATAAVPKLVLTTNHASGAGYYAMAGQGFDPDFIVSWPTGRMAVMEGESAVTAVHGPNIDKAKAAGQLPSAELQASMESMRAAYDEQLDAKYAAARGHVDAIITADETRSTLAFLLDVVSRHPGSHLGPFDLR